MKKFEEENGELKIVFRTHNPIVLLRTVAEGLGVGMISSYMIEDEPILNDEYIEAIPLGHPFDYSVYFTAIVNDNRKNETSLLLSLIHISEPTRRLSRSRMPSSA